MAKTVFQETVGETAHRYVGLDCWQMYCLLLTPPPGGWSGLSTEEGRAKLRKAVGRRMEPLIHRCLNGTSCRKAVSNDREPPEVKHSSRGRKRNQ